MAPIRRRRANRCRSTGTSGRTTSHFRLASSVGPPARAPRSSHGSSQPPRRPWLPVVRATTAWAEPRRRLVLPVPSSQAVHPAQLDREVVGGQAAVIEADSRSRWRRGSPWSRSRDGRVARHRPSRRTTTRTSRRRPETGDGTPSTRSSTAGGAGAPPELKLPRFSPGARDGLSGRRGSATRRRSQGRTGV